MTKPWEKYAKPATGPWEKYAVKASTNDTAQAVPSMPMPQNPVTDDYGPGPGGTGMTELYDQGILPRRFREGQPAPVNDTTATAADGTEMVLNPQTGQMTSRELLAGSMRPSQFDALKAGSFQGYTMGLGDEVAGAVQGPFMREKMRAGVDAAQRDFPKTALAGEIGGAITSPATKAVGPSSNLKDAVTTGAKAGAIYGGGYAAATADGGVMNRIKEGAEGAIAGAVFGAAVPVAVNFGTKAFRKLFKASSQRPTIENLRATKTAAYKAVDASGERFSPADLQNMVAGVKQGLDDVNYLPEADTVTSAMLNRLDKVSQKDISIGQLDKMRQAVWTRYNTSKEPGLLEIIDGIDDLIVSRSATSELMDAARLSNARYKKAELLDLAFQKARDQTASTGSGGNILNKYRQAVTSIINNPKQAKWFSRDEIDTMRKFVEGSTGQNAMRLVGKLSPSGNGLMTALNLGAVSVSPELLAVSAGATAAKAISDRATERGAQKLIGKVSGASMPPVAPPPINYSPAPTNALSAISGSRF